MSKYQAPPPWLPSPYDDGINAAIQALAAGIANEGQQKRALDWIINVLCGAHDLSFRPGSHEGDRDTAFAEGKRFVGSQIVKLIKFSPAQQIKGKRS